MVQVLTGNSGSAVEWLKDKFALDLSLVSRLGGHSFPRTHRGKERFPGMTITYALMEKLEEYTKTQPENVKVITKAKATRLVQDNKGNVIGIEFEKDGKLEILNGPVILATGGYAADFAENGLIKKYRPDIYHLPTTNGDWSTGDGLKMTLNIGGNAVDLEKVQVHPTGLVDPNEPEAKVKFLAAEALRGVGGILLNNEGQRFCDELGHRDYVTGEMWKNKKGPYSLLLNGAAGKEIEWHCKHYMGRGLMKKFNNGNELAKHMKISPSTLEETFNKYNQVAKDNKDPFGKKYFHNLPFKMNDEFYVAIVTPVIHYCMGGLEIDEHSAILTKNKTPIEGLFGCGEVAGGVHGANRLGGSSLLGCVVFGRVAGDSASRYLFRQLSSNSNVNRSSTSVNGAKVSVDLDPNTKRLQLEIVLGGDSTTTTTSSSSNATTTQATSSSSTSGTTASAPVAETKKELKEYTLEEVGKHNTEKDCWVVVNGEVLDVTEFMKEHPGGKKAILLYAGKDATEEFNMLHKPDVVDKYAASSVIGKLKGGSAHTIPKAKL